MRRIPEGITTGLYFLNPLCFFIITEGGYAMVQDLKKTPLYQHYVDAGAKIVEFGGWAMPVQFSSIKEEHNAVRTNVGLFDVSHM